MIEIRLVGYFFVSDYGLDCILVDVRVLDIRVGAGLEYVQRDLLVFLNLYTSFFIWLNLFSLEVELFLTENILIKIILLFRDYFSAMLLFIISLCKAFAISLVNIVFFAYHMGNLCQQMLLTWVGLLTYFLKLF